jgi:hypothetical protein
MRGVFVVSGDNKLDGVEATVSPALVRDSAAQLAPVLRRLGGVAPALLAGLRVRILDGNHLAGTEHRLKELRTTRAAALSGRAMGVLDPELGLVVDVVACEDGHTQERAWFGEVLPKMESGNLQQLAKNIDFAKFQKHPRGPKKPRPKRTHGARIKHVATAQIIAKR